MTDTLVARQRARRDELRADQAGVKRDMSALMAKVEQRGTNATFMASEQRQFDGLERRGEQLARDLRAADERLDELVDQAAAQERSAAVRRESGNVNVEQRSAPRHVAGGPSGWSVGGESSTYHRGPDAPSFFRDLANARRGDRDAIDRLSRNNAERAIETRALGSTGGTGGSGGEFSVPGILVEDWLRLARPGRVTADLFHHEQLPNGVSNIQLPRVSGGTAVGVQTTQMTALPSQDLTTSMLSSNIVTHGGTQVVSRQLLDTASLPFDQIVLQDLVAEFARQVGKSVLTGAGTSGTLRGYLSATSTNVLTWTTSTPTAAGFYGKLAQLQGQIAATRFVSPDTVVLSPARWSWLVSATDNQGRPLVLPQADGVNTMARASDRTPAEGRVGTLLGMDCFVDPSIPTNLGAGTNQDVALVFPRDDVWFWESDLRAESFDQPYAAQLGVLYRVFNYSALLVDRYPASLGQVQGTGMVTPVFPN